MEKYKRPITIKGPYVPSSSPPSLCASPIPLDVCIGDLRPKKKVYVPIWVPKEQYLSPPKRKPDPPFPMHVNAVIQKYCPHRAPLKPLVDAMRLDGRTEEQIKAVRDSYARWRRDTDKEQAAIDKIFGKYNTKTSTTKSTKKILKILKKK
jgi:hypothetical protein